MSRGGLDYLGRAWINAEAAKPHGWRILGVLHRRAAVRYLPITDVDRPNWVALADDGLGNTYDAWGSTPEEALNNLAVRLREFGSGGAAE